MLNDARHGALVLLARGSENATVGERRGEAAPGGALDGPVEQGVVGLEHAAVDEQPRRVEQVDDGGDGDREVMADVVEVGRQVALAGPRQGDHLIYVYVSAESFRDAPGQRGVVGDGLQAAGVA